MAATFILQIDDAIYQLLIPDTSRKMAAAMPPITVRVRVASRAGERANKQEAYLERQLQVSLTCYSDRASTPTHVVVGPGDPMPQLVGVSALCIVLTFALDALFWCGGESVNRLNEIVSAQIGGDNATLLSSVYASVLAGGAANSSAATAVLAVLASSPVAGSTSGVGDVVSTELENSTSASAAASADAETTPRDHPGWATDASFQLVLGSTVVIASGLSWRALSKTATSREHLLRTYKRLLRGRTSFDLDDTRFTVAGANALAEALTLTPSCSELRVCDGVLAEPCKVLFQLLKGNTTLTALEVDEVGWPPRALAPRRLIVLDGSR